MGDLIDREKFIYTLIFSEKTKSIFVKDLRSVIEVANEIPPVEPVERTAKVKLQDICWEDIRRYKEGMCASCGRSVYDHAKYCDECGCRLEWDE